MMYRYIGISIVALLLLAGCVEPPRPIPTVVPGATARSLPATPTLTLTPPSRSTTLAEVSPTIAASPTSTVFPSITPTVTVSPPAPPPPTFSPARTPTRTPTPRPPRKPTSRPAGAPAPSPAPVAKPSAAPPPGAAWYGEYFANPDLNGTPALTRSDAAIAFDWGLGSPAPALPVDRFSVRWTRAVSLPAGLWRFHATTDDGVRVYVDGLPIIDQWHTTASVTYNTSATLSGGNHDLRVDYYDDTGQARIHVWWEPDDGSATDPAHTGAWWGDYFSNPDLSGTPAFGRNDPAVYFDWGEGGPGGSLGGDDFSVRWTRQASFTGGRYLFKVNSDDGVRLWFDWVAIIDEWHDKLGQVTYSRELDVSNGNHTVVVEYYEHGGLASVQVEWQPTNVNWLGNLYTCMALQDSWIKVYRLAPNNRWEDLNPDGYTLNSADGGRAIFGLPINAAYGWDGQPYRVELWVKGRMVRSEGDVFAGQPAFRIMPGADVRTSWPCGAALPTQ